MATTVNRICQLNTEGTQKVSLYTIADTSYATNGTASLTFSDIENPKAILGAYGTGHTVVWDRTNKKLKAFTSGGTEATSTTNMTTGYFLVIGN